jgi:protein SCO1
MLLAACSAPAPRLHGTVLPDQRAAHQFTLTDQDGNSRSLRSMRGSAVALYFGFTHCKDTCPQTLALLGSAKRASLQPPDRIRIVMITVDPARDTGEAMRSFFRRAGVRATGLTGTPAELQTVYKAYGIAVIPQHADIAHTDAIFLISPDGTLVELLDPRTAPAVVAQDLRAVLH